jgi:hypothetical protein
MSACKIIRDKMLEQDAVREIKNVPLSNSTINRHTDGMSHDVEEVLHDKLKYNSFSIQTDESTDSTNESFVVALVKICK